jgi:hypothetical protein
MLLSLSVGVGDRRRVFVSRPNSMTFTTPLFFSHCRMQRSCRRSTESSHRNAQVVDFYKHLVFQAIPRVIRVRTRNGNLSTVRSSLLVDWSANAVRRNAQPPSQSSWSSNARHAVKRAVIEFWSVLFLVG